VSDEQFILVAGLMLAAGLLASLMAGRVRLPGLLLFLGLGMLVGSDVLGWLPFDDYHLAELIGVISLALILFEGGLTAGFREIRPVLRPALSLAVLGTMVTAAIAGVVAMLLFDLSLLEGLLLGSIIASTDGAAIFALLRSSSLDRRLAFTLEGEAGFNDPVAVLLVLGFIEWIQLPDYNLPDMLWLFVKQLGIGAVVGIAVGWLTSEGFKRAHLDTPGLYPVASLAGGAIAYGAAASIDGSGFLAVYLVGLLLGSANIPAKQTITSFHVGLAWVAQLTMFLALGLLIFPNDLVDVAFKGTALALVVVFVARPLATFMALAFEGFSVKEKVVLGWAGLRGAVPIVLAIFPINAGLDRLGLEFLNIVFFAVIVSTLLQGTTFEALARRLGVTTSEPLLPSPLAETGTVRRLGAEVVEYPVQPGDAIVGLRTRELELPREALVNVIVRDNEAIPPRGSTRVEEGDRLHVLVRQEVARDVRELLERWHSGPIGPEARPKPRLVGGTLVFHVRPWNDDDDGDPARPDAVGDLDVIDRLRSRRDVPGSLVLLEDGRYAVTGPTLAIGSRQALGDWVRRRVRAGVPESERVWWEEVLGALALEAAAP
jgi:potassium/hydrogen antiporter